MTPFALHLMRHGEPELTGRLLGRTDCAVTPAGLAACHKSAASLSVTHVISSGLRRARDCAPDTAAIDPRWRELDFGDWDGLPPDAIDRHALARFHADPDACPPPNGERRSALVARVAAAIADLAPEATLVVTHGGAIRAALSVLCGFDLKQGWAIDLPYASVLTLTMWPDTPRWAQITGLRA